MDERNDAKDLLVLYASQSGQAQGLATRLVHMANLCKIPVTPLSMAEYPSSSFIIHFYFLLLSSILFFCCNFVNTKKTCFDMFVG